MIGFFALGLTDTVTIILAMIVLIKMKTAGENHQA